MQKKMLTALGCTLLLSIVAPLALAHNQNAATRMGLSSGVSGEYFTSESGTSVNIDGTWFDSSTVMTTATIGGISASAGGALCDMEVLSDGDDGTFEDATNDEPIVDAQPTPGGMLPEGLFDDGGFGGACHTRHYLSAHYNTLGCPATTSFANDAVSGGSVFIGAACDYGRLINGTSIHTTMALCVVNDGLLNGLGDEPGTIVGCVSTWANCLTAPVPCVGGTPVFSCSPNSSSDAITFGSGGTGAAYPNAAYVASGCTVATAVTFVFHRVDVPVSSHSLSGELPDVGSPTVIPATAGWITE